MNLGKNLISFQQILQLRRKRSWSTLHARPRHQAVHMKNQVKARREVRYQAIERRVVVWRSSKPKAASLCNKRMVRTVERERIG